MGLSHRRHYLVVGAQWSQIMCRLVIIVDHPTLIGGYTQVAPFCDKCIFSIPVTQDRPYCIYATPHLELFCLESLDRGEGVSGTASAPLSQYNII